MNAFEMLFALFIAILASIATYVYSSLGFFVAVPIGAFIGTAGAIFAWLAVSFLYFLTDKPMKCKNVECADGGFDLVESNDEHWIYECKVCGQRYSLFRAQLMILNKDGSKTPYLRRNVIGQWRPV